MKTAFLEEIRQINPWLEDKTHPILNLETYIPRLQEGFLLDLEWDAYWTVLIGPRRAGPLPHQG